MIIENILVLFVALLFFHWIGDFVLQSRWMADNKSKNNVALSCHVGVYMMVLFGGAFLLLPAPLHKIELFVIVNGIIHWIVDFYTSPVTSRLWKEEKIHNFFVMIGFDGYLHTVSLAITLWLVLS